MKKKRRDPMRYSVKMIGFMIAAVIMAGSLAFQTACAESTETLTNDDILKMEISTTSTSQPTRRSSST